MFSLQYHTNSQTGFTWHSLTHNFVAMVHETRGVVVSAFHNNIWKEKDKELSDRLSEDCQVGDFLKGLRERLKEGASANLLRAEGLIA